MTIQTDQPPAVNGENRDEPPITPPVKLRRRPMLIVLGVALIAVGGLLAAWLTTALGDTTKVVALQADVDRGSVIEAGDLRTVEVSGDPSIQTIPAEDLDSMVGQYAARDLTSGALLVPDQVTTQTVPAEGESLVGVALTQAQLPSTQLQSGDPVRIINTPRDQDDLSAIPGNIIEATVVSQSRAKDTGQIVVNVTVPDGQAERLASLVATGRLALVLDSNTDGGQ